jgi:hypothetical protein
MEDELQRLRSDNERLMQANRALEKEVETLKTRLGKHDQLWPIREHLMLRGVQHDAPPSKDKQEEEEPKNAQVENAVASSLSPRSSQREQIITEIIETERRYVKDLHLLQQLFRNAFLTAIQDGDDSVITQEEFETVFSNAETLLLLNTRLLDELTAANRDTVGAVFVEFAPLFKLYAAFCAGLSRALDVIKVLRNRPGSAALLKRVEQIKDLRQLQLESFLILPMQRVLRYVLFLETLEKNTDDSHPDKENVKTALSRLRLIATTVNESVSVLDRAHHLLELNSALSDCPFELVVPARRFVKEGSVKKITSRFVIEDWYVLLSDVLIYCTKRHQQPLQLTYKGHIWLDTAWQRDLPDREHLKNILQLVAPAKTFTFYFDSAEEKKEWREAIDQCIARLVAADPTLLNKRGKVKARHPTSGFYTVLRNLFSYAPEQIEEEKEAPNDLDEFVLISSNGHGVVRVSELNAEEKQFSVEAHFNEFNYWKVE